MTEPLTETPVIAERMVAALRDYSGDGPDILFVPSLINPPTILDLSTERSLLRWLARQEPASVARTAAVCLPHDGLSWRLAGYGPGSGHDHRGVIIQDVLAVVAILPPRVWPHRRRRSPPLPVEQLAPVALVFSLPKISQAPPDDGRSRPLDTGQHAAVSPPGSSHGPALPRPFQVVKRDERREPYDREKLMRGLQIACRKRPVPQDRLERLADSIESEMADAGEREISSQALGTMVMNRLRELDPVAYVRFASVYRNFEDVDAFVKELHGLK